MRKTAKIIAVLLVVLTVVASLASCEMMSGLATSFKALFGGGEPEAKLYTITFANENGDVLQTVEVQEGEIPEYTGETPSKASDDSYTYTFNGWDAELAAANGDVTYYATYTKVANEYTIKFVNWDGSVIEGIADQVLHFGDVITIPSVTPARPEAGGIRYVFDKWSPALTEGTKVTGNATYTATYIENEIDYTYTFYDVNGEVLKTGISNISTPIVPPVYDPIKDETIETKYVFDGWYTAAEGGEKVADFTTYKLTANQNFYPRFVDTTRQYTVKFVDENGNAIAAIPDQTADYGTAITIPTFEKAADNIGTYTFDGWFNGNTKLEAGATISGDVTYQAKFTLTYKNYEINFYDGTTLLSGKSDYHWGDTVTAPATPNKDADAQYTYAFIGWYTAAEGGEKVELGTVAGNATYYARYEHTVRKYTVKFLDKNGNELGSSEVEYGTVPTAPAVPPIADGLNEYVFKAWDKEIVAVTGESTYTATYEELTWVELDTLVAAEGTTNVTFANELFVVGNANVTINEQTKTVAITEAGKLTLNLADFGVTAMGQYRVSIATDSKARLIYTEVWYVTQVVDTVAELKAIGAAGLSTYNTGYYILGDNIDCSAEANMAAGNPGWEKNGFAGTFDGRGKTISNIKMDQDGATSGYGGLFGNLAGCTIKNVVFDGVNYANSNVSLFGRHSFAYNGNNTQLQNLTINVSAWAPVMNSGVICDKNVRNTIANNVVVNVADGLTISSLIGDTCGSIAYVKMTVNLGLGSKITNYYGTTTARPETITVNETIPPLSETIDSLVSLEGTTAVTLNHDVLADWTSAKVVINNVVKENVAVNSGAIALDLADYGVTAMGQYSIAVSAANGDTLTFTEVWYVTQVIDTVAELKALGAACKAGNTTGYYILGDNIDCSAEANMAAGNPGWQSNGFSGTFDGRGKTISNIKMTYDTATSGNGGLFGNLAGCTIKNVIFDQVNYASVNVALLGRHSYKANGNNTTLQNLTINISDWKATGEAGLFVSRGTVNTVHSNCTVNVADGITIHNLLGYEWNSNYGNITLNLGAGSSVTSYYYADTSTAQTTAPSIITVNQIMAPATETVETVVAGEGGTTVSIKHDALAEDTSATVVINNVTKENVAVTSGTINLDLADYSVTAMGKYNAVITTPSGDSLTFTEVWYVTQVINDVAELKALGAACTKAKTAGYYIIGNDIDFEGATVTGACPGWRSLGFGGTLDGRNCTISNLTVSGRGGLFGNLAASTIKNITFDNVTYAEGGSLFGGHSGGQGDGTTTMENITVNVSACTATSEVGIFCSRSNLNTVYNGCVVNIADNVTFHCLLGTEWNSNYGSGITVNLGTGSAITYYYATTTTAPSIVTVK